MALEVNGQAILSYPQFAELMGELDETAVGVEPLAAWLCGEPVAAETLHECLDIDCRLRARSERAHQLIDLACDRLEEHFQFEVED